MIPESAKSGYIYLASPYTHEDPLIREERFDHAVKATYELLLRGFFVFSPIAHTHPMCLKHNPNEFAFDFWREYDTKMIEASVGVAVLQIEGWFTSRGVNAEVMLANHLGKPVYYLDPREVGL